jgi:hypothetical protein
LEKGLQVSGEITRIVSKRLHYPKAERRLTPARNRYRDELTA